LQDTKDDGRADKIVRFGPTKADGNAGGTGVKIYKNYLYAETNDRIVRYELPTSGIEPTAAPETVVSGLPLTGDHPMHPIAIDPQGNLYVDLGSATNSCQGQNRMPNVPGNNPCTELATRAGTWRYDANRLDQRFSPAERFVTGLRNGEGISFDSAGRIFATMHGRDQLGQNWPKLYTFSRTPTCRPRNWSNCAKAPISAGRNAITTMSRRSWFSPLNTAAMVERLWASARRRRHR